MNGDDILDFRKIVICFSELGEKKLLKKRLKRFIQIKEYIFTIPILGIFLYVHCLNLNLYWLLGTVFCHFALISFHLLNCLIVI